MQQGKYFEERGADDFFFRNIDSQRAPRDIEGLVDEVVFHFQGQRNVHGNLAVLGGSAGAVSSGFFRRFPNWTVTNVDLSAAALEFGRKQFPELNHLMADISDPVLPELIEPQDCLVFPTVLCWIDRDRLAGVLHNVRSILKPRGILAVEDFFPNEPRVVPIKHEPGAFTYKMDYSDFFVSAGGFRLKKKDVRAVDDENYELEDRLIGYALLQRTGDWLG